MRDVVNIGKSVVIKGELNGSEDLTIEAMHILSSMFKLTVPRDLSVIGLENAKVSEFTDPPLTTLAQPMDQLAAAAMDIITEHIHNHDHAPKQRILENTLIERESVGPPSTPPKLPRRATDS